VKTLDDKLAKLVCPPRCAAQQSGGRPTGRRHVDGYEVLAALRLAALAHRSGSGTKGATAQPDQEQSDLWLTITQAAQQAGVTDRCIRKWIAQHRLPAARRGDRWFIRRSDLNIQKLTV